jgi:DNA polymerase delta subunit 3
VSDYTSYESVDEEENEPTLAKKGKRAPAKPVKGMEEEVEKTEPSSAAADTIGESKPTIKASTSKSMSGAKGGRKQKTLNTFFGPPKTKK